MRRCARAFHTTPLAFQFKSAVPGATAKRQKTPNKSAGEYRVYKRAAPYSGFQATAPDLPLQQLGVQNVNLESYKQAKAGDLVQWPGSVQAQLHALGCYKPSQQNELFRRPVSLIRENTLKLWSGLEASKSYFITGDSGVGKTSLLLQMQAAAGMQPDWVSVHITRTDRLLDGSSDVVFSEESKLWTQPMYMRRLVRKVWKANKQTLGDVPEDIQTIKTLKELVSRIESLGKKVLLTVDNINALRYFWQSVQTDFDNNKLSYSDLEVPNTILALFKTPGPNVCVVGAESGIYKPIQWEGHAYAPKSEFDPALVANFKDTNKIELPHLSAVESQQFVKFLQSAGLTTASWQDLFQLGNGNPRTILAEVTRYAY